MDNLKIEKGKEISLRNFFKGNHANIELFLDISIKLTQSLGEIHHNGIIHRNLTPDNIFINIDNKEVKITDFSNAILYSADNSKTMIKSNFTGDIKYLSPEQSAQKEGPLGFSVDYYSLGVIFYEMLTGKLPFEADSTAEWVQVHATRIPEKPNAINSQIPSIISEITMKLLSKNAHERYQTAYGLLRDLMECRRQWHAKGNIEPFKLGEFDITPHFKLPTRLFGRKREAKALQKAFERACSGEGGLIFISGCAGIGKTMLINEIVKPLAVSKGYYAYGKFEQLRQNVPYAAISSALTSVVRQLMTESKDKLNEWKREIQRAIGNNGALITEIIPNLNILIGHQPSVEMLQPKEAINRFFKVFDDFIKVFSKMNTPLVIFLDDLQWADVASLRLLKFISKNVDSRFLLIIGAYRDNEIEPTHPLQAAIEEIEKEEISFMQIQLFPLNLMDVTEFIAETFRCNKEKAELLAKILYRKTYGNPLFLSQMLISIYNQRLITFNIKQGSWEWKSESINRLQIPDDVLDLILARLKKLKKEQLDILKLASCIGNKFNIKTLAAVSQKAEAEVAVLMEQVIAEGLVIVLTDEKKEGFPTETDTENYIFEFLHDRVSQAVYTLLTDKEKKVAHLKVGNLILQSTKQEEFNDRILTAMDHINRGIDLVTDSQERLKLAQYNLVAGRKAKASAAFDTAAKCFKAGITLLPLNAWELCYDLCYHLYVEHAQDQVQFFV
nr:serine/threonine-protein kinase [Tepidanaerobacter sp. GT38]